MCVGFVHPYTYSFQGGFFFSFHYAKRDQRRLDILESRASMVRKFSSNKSSTRIIRVFKCVCVYTTIHHYFPIYYFNITNKIVLNI